MLLDRILNIDIKFEYCILDLLYGIANFCLIHTWMGGLGNGGPVKHTKGKSKMNRDFF